MKCCNCGHEMFKYGDVYYHDGGIKCDATDCLCSNPEPEPVRGERK
jgi:hypothetical protein